MGTATLSTVTDPVLRELRRDIEERRIAIFLGAGVSAALAEKCDVDGHNLASWGGLLAHGARHAQTWCGQDDNFAKSIDLDIAGDTGSMLAAAEKVSRALKEHDEFGRWLRASIGTLKYSNQAEEIAAHLKAFAWRQIPLVTTNYDNLLEQATGLEAITWEEKEKLYRQLTDRSADRTPKIIHLHGHFDSPNSVVLGVSDYLNLLGNEFLATLRTVLGFTKSLLFVGFGKGLDDPHFAKFIKLTQQVIDKGDQRIYRLCRTKDRADLLKQRMGTPVVYGDDHKLLAGFLGSLLPSPVDLPPKPGPVRKTPSDAEAESRPFMPKCVVLVGRYGNDEQRRRTLQVVQQHLHPACQAANYFVPDQGQDEDLFDASMSLLLHAPMAIAYLGRRAWPSDILAKVGFRLATGKPLVLVFERGEEFRAPGPFESLQMVMRLREMRTISVATADLEDEKATAKVNEQITRELQEQSGKNFGARPIHPMAVVQIDTIKDDQEYIAATDSTFPLLTDDKYLLGRRGIDVVHSLQARIEPEQWPYFEREQDRLYKLFLNEDGGKLDALTPIARIPLVYKEPVGGVTKAILPIVTRHASRGGIHNMEVLHLDVTASMMRMADGHYELVSPRGVNEVSCSALAEDRWFYSPAPGLEISTEGLIVDTNLICRVLLEATDGSLHGQPIESLLARLSLDGEELAAANWGLKFDLDSVRPLVHGLGYASPAFGKIGGRGVARPVIDLVSGRPVGMSWNWIIKDIERETAFRSAMRDHLTSSLKWDVYAANYDRVLPLCDYYSDTVRRHVEHLTPPQSEGIEKVCDIGAGTGNVSLQLLEHGCQVTAVDLSRAMLRHLQAKTTIGYTPHLRVMQQTAERLTQLASGEFDAVTVMMALYGMGQPAVALDECIRILKPGGKLVITEPNPQLDVEAIIQGAQADLEKKGLLKQLAVPWQRVQEAGRWLKETIGFNIDQIEAVLQKNRFSMLPKIPSHYGQCTTIVATKPK